MAQKKKKKSKNKSVGALLKQEIAEEILALEAIYAEDFVLHEDGLGFYLKVTPHPGALEANFVSVELHIRSGQGHAVDANASPTYHSGSCPQRCQHPDSVSAYLSCSNMMLTLGTCTVRHRAARCTVAASIASCCIPTCRPSHVVS